MTDWNRSLADEARRDYIERHRAAAAAWAERDAASGGGRIAYQRTVRDEATGTYTLGEVEYLLPSELRALTGGGSGGLTFGDPAIGSRPAREMFPVVCSHTPPCADGTAAK